MSEVTLTEAERRELERIEDSGDTQGLAWRVDRIVAAHLAEAVPEGWFVVNPRHMAELKRAESDRDEARGLAEEESESRINAANRAIQAEAENASLRDALARVEALANEWEPVEVPGRLVHDDVFREHARELRTALAGGGS